MTVKHEPGSQRSQRKPIVKIPTEMLRRQRELFPELLEENATVALFALRVLAQRINDRTNDALVTIGLNAAKYNHLIVLYLADGPITLNELSNLIHTTNSSVTLMVDSLEREGLVKRIPNTNDRRSFVLRLTANGRKRVEAAVPLRYASIEAGMSRLSNAEKAQLASLLLRIGAGFDGSDA